MRKVGERDGQKTAREYHVFGPGQAPALVDSCRVDESHPEQRAVVELKTAWVRRWPAVDARAELLTHKRFQRSHTALGVARLRISIDVLPVEIPAVALPDQSLPIVASVILQMIVPYEDAAARMLANLDGGHVIAPSRGAR
jgi:hypothetical protein